MVGSVLFSQVVSVSQFVLVSQLVLMIIMVVSLYMQKCDTSDFWLIKGPQLLDPWENKDIGKQ